MNGTNDAKLLHFEVNTGTQMKLISGAALQIRAKKSRTASVAAALEDPKTKELRESLRLNRVQSVVNKQ